MIDESTADAPDVSGVTDVALAGVTHNLLLPEPEPGPGPVSVSGSAGSAPALGQLRL